MTFIEIALDEDHHVHSSRSSDAEDDVTTLLRVAVDRSLRRLVITDHIRSSTTWVDEHTAALRHRETQDGLELLVGVETKMLDSAGRLDVPKSLPALDRVLIADHQWPGPHGPRTPAQVVAALNGGEVTPSGVVDILVTAMCRAMSRVPNPQLAHPFSLLPKVGLSEGMVGDDHIAALVEAARHTGAVVEVNEKWSCPGPRLVAALADGGVRLVASSDAHRAGEVGRYRGVADVLAAARAGTAARARTAAQAMSLGQAATAAGPVRPG